MDPSELEKTDPNPSRAGQTDAGDSASVDRTVVTRAKMVPAAAESASSVDKSDSFKMASPKQIDLTGRTIGGYKISRMLGAGGMGAVCLGHQISLDRDVALKILPAKMAANPDLLMRFTREALSAARLTHHNIIQIYDIGNDQGIHYIAMEYVDGCNLTQLVKEKGRLNAQTAAGYVLQSARGLQYAHARGIIHRDIKPENLMLNEQGVIKIADMGLAKMRGEPGGSSANIPDTKTPDSSNMKMLKQAKGDLTMVDVAMGTPAYMPPEQARDASTVDHRADQYSLGCTLYYLCTGKPPFNGNSAYDIISKHITEPPPPLEASAPEAPRELAAIVHRMMAKEPDERYPKMADVISDLEIFLGLEADKGAQVPNQAHVRVLEQEQAAYYAAPSVKKKKAVLVGFFGLMLVAMIGLGFGGDNDWAAAALFLMLLAPAANFVYEGVTFKTHIYRLIKSHMRAMSFKHWLLFIAAVILVLGVLGGPGILAAIGSFILIMLYQLVVMRPIRTERGVPLANMMEMFKDLRLRGVSEDVLREFVGRYSGNNWEEFYEDLFGYEAMIQARERWGAIEQLKTRKQHATWRDPLIRWLNHRDEERKKDLERIQLIGLEADRLKAEGIDESEANRQADLMASQLMKQFQSLIPQASTPPTMIPVAGERFDKKKDSEERRLPVVREKGKRGAGLVGLLRGLFGVGICGIYAAHSSPLQLTLVPKTLGGLENFIYNPFGLLAGVLLIVSIFARKQGLANVIALGAAMMIGAQAVASMAGSVPYLGDPHYLQGVGIILVVVGGGLPILDKITGR